MKFSEGYVHPGVSTGQVQEMKASHTRLVESGAIPDEMAMIKARYAAATGFESEVLTIQPGMMSRSYRATVAVAGLCGNFVGTVGIVAGHAVDSFTVWQLETAEEFNQKQF